MWRECSGPLGDLTVLASGAFVFQGVGKAKGALAACIIDCGVQYGVSSPWCTIIPLKKKICMEYALPLFTMLSPSKFGPPSPSFDILLSTLTAVDQSEYNHLTRDLDQMMRWYKWHDNNMSSTGCCLWQCQAMLILVCWVMLILVFSIQSYKPLPYGRGLWSGHWPSIVAFGPL